MISRVLLRAAIVIAAVFAGSPLRAQSSIAPAGAADSFSPAMAPSEPAATAAVAPAEAAPQPASPAPAPAAAASSRSIFGVSGALRAALLNNGLPVSEPLVPPVGEGEELPHFTPVHGTVRRGILGEPANRGEVVAPDGPGMWKLEAPAADSTAAPIAPFDSLTFITTVPFTDKRDGHLNGYHIGTYPTEHSPRSDQYAPPAGFIEVTPQNQEVPISRHFRLRQFLTKDQFDVWPKYVALNLRLVDKLELVIQELNAMGVRALGVHVMSGFRTPQYNGPGGDGRATLSRHMYGDAADIWVDGDHDGYIDDLNGDGRHDIRDAEVVLRAVERVEQKYPELTGGAGLYEASHDHGPYVHVDVRGSRARW